MHHQAAKLPLACIAMDVCTAAGVAGSFSAKDTHTQACVQVDAHGWRAAKQAHGQGDAVLCRPARRRLPQVRSMLLELLLDGPREGCCTAMGRTLNIRAAGNTCSPLGVCLCRFHARLSEGAGTAPLAQGELNDFVPVMAGAISEISLQCPPVHVMVAGNDAIIMSHQVWHCVAAA